MCVEIPFANDLNDGEMRVLKVGDANKDKILISKVNGKIHAIGAFCSHFGVPLVNGVLFGDKVICPAHAAAFSAVTGELDGSPGLDGVPSYDVSYDGDTKKYFVTVPENLE